MTQKSDSHDSDSPYEFDEPARRISLKSVPRFALGLAGAAASITFGLQVVGPALADIAYPRHELASALNKVGREPGSEPQSVTSLPAFPEARPGLREISIGVPVIENALKPALKSTQIESLRPTSPRVAVPALGAESPAAPNTIQAPTFSNTTYGSVSSATPSGGSVASGGYGSGAGSTINLRGGREGSESGHSSERDRERDEDD